MVIKVRIWIVWILSMVLIGAAMLPNARAADQAAATAAAAIAAQSWLKLVDQGDYHGSFEQASSLSKSVVGPEQWSRQVGAVRKALGALISRQQKSATYSTSLPGAPDGQYVVIQYDSSFQNKKSAIETVTPMLDKDGQWRVSGYQIR
jgi:hypothetical protein